MLHKTECEGSFAFPVLEVSSLLQWASRGQRRRKKKLTPKWVYTSLFAEGKSAIPQYVQLLLATAKTRRRCETNCGSNCLA